MAELARVRPVFHSEADPQHAFARVLWELAPEVECRLEARQTLSDKCRAPGPAVHFFAGADGGGVHVREAGVERHPGRRAHHSTTTRSRTLPETTDHTAGPDHRRQRAARRYGTAARTRPRHQPHRRTQQPGGGGGPPSAHVRSHRRAPTPPGEGHRPGAPPLRAHRGERVGRAANGDAEPRKGCEQGEAGRLPRSAGPQHHGAGPPATRFAPLQGRVSGPASRLRDTPRGPR